MRADGSTRRNDRRITLETAMTTDQRLARLEKQCRFFKAGLALVTVALAVVLLIGAGQDQDRPKALEEVRAKRFVVVGGDGGEVVWLNWNGLTVRTARPDEGGGRREVVSVTRNGLAVHDRTGSTTGAVLALTNHEHPALTLWQKWGQVRLQMRLSPKDGSPAICLFDDNRRVRCILGAPRCDTFPEDPAHDCPESSLVMYDADGNPIFKAPK